MSAVVVRNVLLFGALVGVSMPMHATLAYESPANDGTQSYPDNLGLIFTVNAPIDVTGLGVFNAAGDGTITGTIQVAIFNSVGALVTPVDTFHGLYATTGFGFNVLQTISPVFLAPGSYTVVAQGFNASDQNGNLYSGSVGPTENTGGGLITFTGASYDSNGSLDFPTSCVACSSPGQNQFDAGTFTFISAAPEPGTVSLFGLGAAALWAVRKRIRLT